MYQAALAAHNAQKRKSATVCRKSHGREALSFTPEAHTRKWNHEGTRTNANREQVGTPMPFRGVAPVLLEPLSEETGQCTKGSASKKHRYTENAAGFSANPSVFGWVPFFVDGASCSVQEKHRAVSLPIAKLDSSHKLAPTLQDAASTFPPSKYRRRSHSLYRQRG